MNDLATAIRTLDDPAAEAILATVAEHRLRPRDGDVTALTPEVARALADAVGESDDSPPATRGELARLTLLLLAEDPDRRREIEPMVRNRAANLESYGAVAVVVVTTAALLALQIGGKVSYDKKNGWKLKVEKKAADSSLLAKIVGLFKRLPLGS